MVANFVLAKAGIKPSDVSIIGVGAGSGAVAAMRSGQIDAISNLDPVITLLQRKGDLKIVSDTRIVAEADKVFGGPMPAGCLYAPQTFIDKNPNTVPGAGQCDRARRQVDPGAPAPSDIIKAVPESYLLGDRAVYLDAFLAAQGRALARRPRSPRPAPRPRAARWRASTRRSPRPQDRPERGLHQRVRSTRQGKPRLSAEVTSTGDCAAALADAPSAA